MNIATPLALKPTSPSDRNILPLHGFVELHRDALYHAASVLCGSEGGHLVDEISDALSREWVLSRRTVSLLSQLEDILFLENVGDPDRAESGYFAAIDPEDPVVEEICLLADFFAKAFHSPSNATAHDAHANNGSVRLCSHYPADAQSKGDL